MLMCAACKEKEKEREKYERMKKLTKHKLEGKSIKVRKKFNRPHKVIRRLNSNPLSGSYMQFYSLSLPLTLSLSLCLAALLSSQNKEREPESKQLYLPKYSIIYGFIRFSTNLCVNFSFILFIDCTYAKHTIV